jgi:Uma2 family endonuclease
MHHGRVETLARCPLETSSAHDLEFRNGWGISRRLYDAPFDVRLLDKRKSDKANKEVYTVIQPDVCIICDAEKLDDKGCIGAPDLIVEILSPGNSQKEMRTKKLLYEENMVREYWIVDPEHENVFQFLLTKEGNYSPATIYVYDEQLECAIFPDLTLDLKAVFQS